MSDNSLTVKTEAQNMLQMIADAAKDPAVDVSKMEALVNLRIKMMDKQAEINFNEAINRLQADLPVIIKKSKMVHNGKLISTYAKYEDIHAIIGPLLKREGFHISFKTENSDGKIFITARLTHKDGHFREAGMPLAVDSSGSKNNLQGVGSTITYGKRYSVGMLLDLIIKDGVEDDDDGNQGAGKISDEQAAKITEILKAKEAAVSPENKANIKPRFLGFLGVKEIAEISAGDYNKAVNALNSIGGAK